MCFIEIRGLSFLRVTSRDEKNKRSPGFLTLSVSDNLEPKLWWLRDKLDVSLAGAAKILTTYPNLFGLSIEASLEPKLW